MRVPHHTLELAWIGDAVLHLYSRRWSLRSPGELDRETIKRFVSNQFLSCIGQPDHVEATIGALYEERGLEAAFEYIESTLVPVFRRQELNRKQPRPRRKPRR